MNKKNLIWLASYPKSGNTWFRLFLTALLHADRELNFNALFPVFYYADYDLFEEATCLNASEMTTEEIDILKPEIAKYFGRKSESPKYIKIHEAFRINSKGKPNVPSEYTDLVLYFIRNPLEVTVSFAHHLNQSIDTIIERMRSASTLAAIEEGPEFFNLPERMGNWSEHVESWHNSGLELITIRYEDMSSDPLPILSKVVARLGLEYSMEEIQSALEQCDFHKMLAKEKEGVFKEKPADMSSFFRKGKIDSYKESLTKDQIDKIVSNHEDMMRKFNYL